MPGLSPRLRWTLQLSASILLTLGMHFRLMHGIAGSTDISNFFLAF